MYNNFIQQTYEIGGISRTNSMCFGSVSGFTIVDTNFSFNNSTNTSAPRIISISYLTNGGIKEINDSNLSNIILPNDVSNIKIITSIHNRNLLKQYKIYIENKSEAKNILESENGQFNIWQLPYGNNNLEVIVESGNEKGKVNLKLYVEPKWHQTSFFKFLILAAIASLLYILYNFRIKQIKKVFAVRQKISRDLHDDIGSTLSAIKLYASLPNQNDKTTIAINDNAAEVLAKLDDIIWASNPKNDTYENLSVRILSFIKPLAQSHNIILKTNIDEVANIVKIDEYTRQCIYLVFKEASNNTIKYAEATEINISMQVIKSKMNCFYSDNGKGFDVLQTTNRNGLINMKQRVVELGGQFSLTSKLLEGTRIEFHLSI
jgi:nitrate/nitrite-specific signal transduction histidine kinase